MRVADYGQLVRAVEPSTAFRVGGGDFHRMEWSMQREARPDRASCDAGGGARLAGRMTARRWPTVRARAGQDSGKRNRAG
ncbi:hypothetical protein GCM10009834_41310 [Streptomonospora arabica]